MKGEKQMSSGSERKVVFLDTEVFEKLHFSFGHSSLRRLVELVEGGRVQLILTSVTEKEVQAHIGKRFRKAHETVRKAVKSHPILRNFPELKLEEMISEAARQNMEEELQKNYARFKEDANIEVLPIDGVDPEQVFQSYFAREAPFGEGQKSEFPDAFAAAALVGWGEREGKDIYVVSADKDWKTICEKATGLVHFDSLPKLLEPFSDQDVVIGIREGFATQTDQLEHRITADFQDLAFQLVDVDGDVDEVTDVEVQLGEMHVVRACGGHATVEVPFVSDFQASVSFMVPGTGTWDSEDKVLLFQEKESGVVDVTEERSVLVQLQYDESDPGKVQIQKIDLDYDEPVWIEVSDPMW